MRRKRTLIIISAAILSLVGCWGIGQALHREKQDTEVWSITYEGSRSTEDNPWGKTAGDIEWEGEKYIFLTPNTAAVLENVPNTGTMELQYMIHPWVSESSDGLGMKITLTDRVGDIVGQQELFVEVKDSFEMLSLDMNDYADVCGVKISCNNGKNDDDSADWLILGLTKG